MTIMGQFSRDAKSVIGLEQTELRVVPVANARLRLSDRLRFRVCRSIEDAAPYWEALERHNTASIYQSLEWNRIALATLERDHVHQLNILVVFVDDEPAMLLPLMKSGELFPVLRWIGGSHVNFNMALQSPDFARLAGEREIAAILAELRRLFGNSALLMLCCQPESWKGNRNALAGLKRQTSTNPAYVMSLEEGFDALLVRGNAKRKRKKFRAQCKTAAAMGGWRLVVADDRETALHLVDIFLTQKSERLRSLGIRDSFSAPGAKAMLRQLADHSIGTPEPLLRLYGLEVAGKIRAVFGGGLRDRHLSGYFSSIADDDFSDCSPGEMLMYLVAEHSASNGVASIDLGNGDERYKRSWCDTSIVLYDVILPLGTAAWPRALLLRSMTALRKLVRNHQRLWEMVKTVRRARAAFSRN